MGFERLRGTRDYVTRFAMLVIIIAGGCEEHRSPPAPKIDFHKVVRWPLVEESKSGAAGVDYGEIWCALERRTDRPLVAIWFDAWPAGQQVGRYRGTLEASEHTDPIRFDNGQVVTVEYRTQSGHDGILGFKIDDQEYDLDSGRLFLVSLRGDAPHVRQLKRDIGPEAMPFRADSIAATAQADAEIRGFFSSVRAK